MKKFLLLTVIAVLLAACATFVCFAENDPYASPDEDTVRVVGYIEGTETVGINLSKFEANGVASEDDPCIGEVTALFNAGAPVKAVLFKIIWAGRSDLGTDADYTFELFSYDTDIATSIQGTPIYTVTRHIDGDMQLTEHPEMTSFNFDTPLAVGKYVIRFRQLGVRTVTEGTSPYIVLPSIDAKYTDSYIEYGSEHFGFIVDFVKTEGVEEYFTSLTGEKVEFELEKEQTLAEREGNAPYDIVKDYGGEYAILTPEIPDGKVLYSIRFMEAPTWSNANDDSNVTITVYKWKGDYDKSVAGKCLFTQEILGHKDNSDLIVTFDGKTLRYGNQYLIVYTAEEGCIGYWSSTQLPEGWTFFGNYGDELDVTPAMKVTYAKVGDLGPEPTEEPTQVPTEAPTEAPTDVPAATEAPAATSKPVSATEAPSEESSGSNMTGIIIVIACVVVAAACAAIVLIKKKRK